LARQPAAVVPSRFGHPYRILPQWGRPRESPGKARRDQILSSGSDSVVERPSVESPLPELTAAAASRASSEASCWAPSPFPALHTRIGQALLNPMRLKWSPVELAMRKWTLFLSRLGSRLRFREIETRLLLARDPQIKQERGMETPLNPEWMVMGIDTA